MNLKINNRKVSVIIPCYNHGNYIQETVNSILTSTYPNIEIVIVNDGSTDKYTNKILVELSNKYDNIKVITTENQGTAGACKVAVENSTGDFILPMGSDDKIHPNYIEKAVEILNNNPNIGIVYCNAEFFGEKVGPWILPPFSIEQMKHGNCIFCAALYRKEDYDKTEGYHADMRYWEDYDLWLSLLELGLEVYKLPEVYFYYRQTKKQKTNSVKQDHKKIENLQRQIRNHHSKFFNITTIQENKQQVKQPKKVKHDKTFILF